MLRDKWKRELQRRFGVTARICGAEELVETLAGIRSGETRDYALVASLQGLRPPAGWDESDVAGPRVRLAQLLSDSAKESPLIALLVIDEAHYLKNPETRTFELGSLLRQTTQYAVLLSATPVHLHSEDLFHLLRIVDEDVFNRRESFEFIRQANEGLVSVRDLVLAGAVGTTELREHLEQILGHPLLKGNRQLERLRDTVDDLGDLSEPRVRVDVASRLEAANLFGFAVTRTRRREVREWRAIREADTLDVQMNEVERAFYDRVTDTVRAYCAREEQAEGFLLVMPQRQVASSMAAAMWAWSNGDGSITEALYEELGIDLPAAEVASLGPLVSEIRAKVSGLADLTELTRHDTKYATLRDRLLTFLRERPREKIVLFSSFRATLRYLRQRLIQDGVSCGLLLGGDPEQQATLESFASPQGPSVLLSSEVGSEGIDLQFAWVLVNYDLPWNPMKVEQRIGRLDRLGQQSRRVLIWNLVHANTIDERIYSRLLVRLGIFERTIGGLEVVLGERINALTRDLMQQHLTPEQEAARIDQTAVALENIRQSEDVLEREATSLVAYGDYILQQVEAARSLSRRVKSEDTLRYVLELLGAQYPGCQVQRDPGDPSVVFLGLSPLAKNDLADFLRQRRSTVTTALTRNDPAPTRCRFDDRVKVVTHAGEEIVNLFHPLVRFMAHQAETKGAIRYPAIAARVSTTKLPMPMPPGDYWLAVTQWTFEALRVSEQLWFGVRHAHTGEALSDADAERFVTFVADAGDDWSVGVGDIDTEVTATQIEESLIVQAWNEFQKHEADARAQNEDRADAQMRSLDTHLQQQRAKYQELGARHLQHGNAGLARVQERNIERLAERIQRERLVIDDKRHVRSRMNEICIGIVRVS